MVLFRRSLTSCGSDYGEEEIVAQYSFVFHTGELSMYGKVFIVHILQQHLLVLGIIERLILGIDIYSLVALLK